MEKEIWKPIKGFEDRYIVSNYGNVRSLDTPIVFKNGNIIMRKGKPITPHINNSGYYRFSASAGGKHYTTILVHRAVAEAFIPNPLLLSDVNHINENKLDNRVANLCWMSHGENIRYGECLEKIKRSSRKKPVVGRNVINGSLLFFESQHEAQRHGFQQGCVSGSCYTGRPLKGYVFSFCTEEQFKNKSL